MRKRLREITGVCAAMLYVEREGGREYEVLSVSLCSLVTWTRQDLPRKLSAEPSDIYLPTHYTA